MSAERLLTAIAAAGLSARIDGENLRISGAVLMPPTWLPNGCYGPPGIPQAKGCRWWANRLQGRRYPKAYPLPPNAFNPRKEGRGPYSEDCRPLAWQGGSTERNVTKEPLQ
jgi:hypothetical protein